MAFDMRDRLDILRQSVTADPHITEEPPPYIEEGNAVGDFLQQVNDLTRAMNDMTSNIQELQKLYDKMLSSVHNEEAKHRSEDLMETIKREAQRTNSGLNRLKSIVQQEENKNLADSRLKEAQYTVLARKFRDIMSDYNRVQEDYRDKCKDRIKRQLKITGKNVTDDQVDDMVESNDTAIFAQDILIDTAQKRQALNEVEERHKEILSLEQNIRELHEMFVDLAILVDEQGEIIDRIEYHVDAAAVHVDQARKTLKKAVSIKKSNNRKKFLIICIVGSTVGCILLVIVLIIAIVVGLYRARALPGVYYG